MFNKFIGMGRLTRDVEFKELGQYNVCKLPIAVNWGFKDKQETVFIDVELWGVLADISKSLIKGDLVFVEGRLKQDNFEVEGQKRSKIKIKADVLRIMTPKDQSHNQDGSDQQGEDSLPF